MSPTSYRLQSNSIESTVDKFGLSILSVDSSVMRRKFPDFGWVFESSYYVLDFEQFTSPVAFSPLPHPQLGNPAVFLDAGKVYFPAKELRSFLLSQFEEELREGLKHYAAQQFQFSDPRFAASMSQMTSLVGSPIFHHVQLVREEPISASEVSVESLPTVEMERGWDVAVESIVPALHEGHV